MSDVREDILLEAEGTSEADTGLAEETTGEVQDGNQITVHVSHPEVDRQIHISEMSARTLAAVLDTITGKGSAAKFQLAIAQQELERGLAALEPPPAPIAPNRSARRASLKGQAAANGLVRGK